MGVVKDSRTTANTLEHVAKHLSLDTDSNLTAAGTNTLSGATTISGALTVSGTSSGGKRLVTNKTASYTVTVAESGTLFTNAGDTDAITFGLPAVTNNSGVWYDFKSCVASDAATFAVAGATAVLSTFNNIAATSVKYGTTNEVAGGAFRVICDGTKWHVFIMAEEGQTVTVA